MPTLLALLIAFTQPIFAALTDEEQTRLSQVMRQGLAYQNLMPVKNQGSKDATQRRTEAINVILRELRGVEIPNCPVQSQPEYTNWHDETGSRLVKQGHSFDLSAPDFCSSDPCQARATARIALSVPKSPGVNLRSVLDTVTSEFRSPNGKDVDLGTFLPMVYRHYWSADGDAVTKLGGAGAAQPMNPEKTYVMKKCLKVQEGWSCNDLHYQILKLSEETFAIVTTEIRTDKFNKAEFSDKQKENFFDGFTAVTIVKEDGDRIEIYDSNHFNTETKDQTSGLKTADSHDVIEKIVGQEMDVLRKRLPGSVYGCVGAVKSPRFKAKPAGVR